MMNKGIVLLNIRDNVKNTTYLLMTIVFSVLGAFMLIYQGKGLLVSAGASFILNYLYFAFNLSVFSMVMTVVLTNLAISEKSSGRLEYYLANMVELKMVHYSYSVSTFLLSIIAIFSFNSIFLGYCLVTKEFALLKTIYTLPTLLCILTFLLFCYSLTYLLNIIVLLAKKPQTVRSVVFITSFIVMYGTLFPATQIAKIGILNNMSITIIFSICFFVLFCITMSLTLVLRKSLKKETIVLSLKQ